MKFVAAASLPGVILIEPLLFEDGRGFFMEMYHKEKFSEGRIPEVFVQDNLSRSEIGTLRGLHYQLDRPQGKLIWALEGEIFDVAVDIRQQSPTFGKWHSTILSGKNKRGIYIPPNFAHGFCVLSDAAVVFYKCTEFYSPSHERAIRWDDPTLSIDWPILAPSLSEKDKRAKFLKDAELPSLEQLG